MPHSLTLQINLENFKRFKRKFLLSSAQKRILQEFQKTNDALSEFKKKDSFSFTDSNEFHISRGRAYAITQSLQERIDQELSRLNDLHRALKQKKICLQDLHTALEQENNSLNDLLATLEHQNINLDDLSTVLNEKKINLQDLKTALKPKGISLEDLQAAFEDNYNIKDKELLSFILLALVEPVWIPGNLAVLALSLLLPIDYHCSNQGGMTSKESELQVNTNPDNNTIEFCLNLTIRSNEDTSLTQGSVAICFSIEKTIPLHVKFLPITMEFNFSDEQASKHFQQKLAQNYKSWLFYHNELNDIPIKLDNWRALQIDFWVFSISIGLLIGLSAMISLSALGLAPIAPLLLPPIGLALGLGLACFINSAIHVNIKKEQEKIQRPIHVFNRTPIATTSFFNYPRSINPSNLTEKPCILINR